MFILRKGQSIFCKGRQIINRFDPPSQNLIGFSSSSNGDDCCRGSPACKASKDVIISNRNNITTIKLNRPASGNALSLQMYETLALELVFASADPATKIVLLTGTGKTFCSGNDLNEGFGKKTYDALVPFVDALIDCSKPVIAVVNGPANGIGVTCLGLCDVVYASDKAYFRTPFTSFAIIPEACSSYTFPRIMGSMKANELLYFNGTLRAKEAEKVGFVNKVFPDKELISAAGKLIEQHGKLPMNALVLAKEMVRKHDRQFLHKLNREEGMKLLELFKTEEFFDTFENYVKRRK